MIKTMNDCLNLCCFVLLSLRLKKSMLLTFLTYVFDWNKRCEPLAIGLLIADEISCFKSVKICLDKFLGAEKKITLVSFLENNLKQLY